MFSVYTCISLLLYSQLLFTPLDVLYQDPKNYHRNRKETHPGGRYGSEGLTIDYRFFKMMCVHTSIK